MGIRIASNTDTVLELPSLAGTLAPGATRTVENVPADLLKALDLGLVVAPDGAEAPSGLPPVIFEHRHPAVLPITASRAYYVRVLRSPGGFNDGSAMRNFLAYYANGAGMSCAFSNDGLSWDREKAVTGIVANGYHVVCAVESATHMRVLYWNPDVPNQPYNMAGLRTAVCNPSVDPSVFTEDEVCTGNLVTGGSQQVWNRGHYGPSFLWSNPAPTSIVDKPFTWRYAMLFIASTGGNDSMGLGYSEDGLVWKLYGNAPVLSGLINPQPWEGVNAYVSSCHVERMADGRWWMLYSGGAAGNSGIGYAWSWDRLHWTKASFNPVFKAGAGAFLQRCYTPTLVKDADGSFLLYRSAKDASLYRTFVSRVRAQALDYPDLLGLDRLNQGLAPKGTIRRGTGTAAARDLAIPNPGLGDEWFTTDLNGGTWQKHTGTDWK